MALSPDLRPGDRPKPWRPNAEFFLSDPRSAQIREVCSGIIERTEILAYPSEFSISRVRKLAIRAELETLGGRLVEFGITPNINAELPEAVYRSSPVITAEWIAGQLLPLTGYRIDSPDEVITSVQEPKEPDIDSTSVDSDLMPRISEDIAVGARLKVSRSILAFPRQMHR